MLYYPKKIKETKLIARDVSLIGFWIGILMIIPMLLDISYGNPEWPMYIPCILLASVPSFFFMKYLKSNEAPFTSTTIITIAVTWITLCVMGSYPFIAVGEMGILDGVFESVSSVSTAGLTNIQFPESVPQGVLLWRAMLAWIGGIGITAMAFYSILQSESVSKILLGDGFDRIKPSLSNSAKEILKIYSFWTVLGIVALILIGMPVFDSVSLSLNSISTTGMNVRDNGWLYYQQTMPDTFPFMAGIVAVLMIMGAISFIAHYRFFKNKNLKAYLQDSETRIYLIILVLGMLIVGTYLFLNNQDPLPLTYETLSTSTTGGFEIIPYVTDGASTFIMSILILMALIGGSSNSAAGGLKVKRVYMLFKYIIWKVGQQISPAGTVSHFKLEGKPVKIEDVTSVAVYAFIYCTAIIFITILLISFNHSPVDAALTVTSAQAGGGVSAIPGWEFAAPGKVALIFTMLFGRLEFIPMFALFAYMLKRH